jgi:MoxR-like ATPase
MNDTLFTNLQNFRASLNARFLEREDVIDGVLASLITQQNTFLFGVPGTGKSELVKEISKGFKGSTYFGYLLSPTADPSELFGPVAVSKLLKDEYTRDTEGYLPSSNIAFLDELFRGSSAVLNSLLTILNERTFNNGREVITTPIQSIVAATNSFPTEESLAAFCDRFLFRPTVELLKKPTSKRRLDTWAVNAQERPTVESNLVFKDLLALQKDLENIAVSEEFLDKFGQIMDMLNNRGISVSDRRRVQILKFMKGWAVVQGDDQIHPEHLHRSLKHIVYKNTDDINVIKEVLEQVVPTNSKLIADLKRIHSGVLAEFHSVHRGEAKTVTELNKFVIQLRKMHKDLAICEERLDRILSDRLTMEDRKSAMRLGREVHTSMTAVIKSISEVES